MNQPRVVRLLEIRELVGRARDIALNFDADTSDVDERTPFIQLCDAVTQLLEMALRQEL